MSGKPSNLREITIWRNEKMEQVKLLMTELSPELTRLCAETLAAQDIAVTVCEKDGAKALAPFRRKSRMPCCWMRSCLAWTR